MNGRGLTLVACVLIAAGGKGATGEDVFDSAYEAAYDSLITGSVTPRRPMVLTEAGQYCVNIADAAADARFAWQKSILTALEEEIDTRILMLEQKRAEYEEWVRIRDEYLSKSEQGVIDIYGRMRPDAAAEQMALLDYATAASILSKLNSRVASAILNEMTPAHAARLTKTIVSVAKPPEEADGS